MLLKGMILLFAVVACHATPRFSLSSHLSPRSYYTLRAVSSSYQMLKQEWEVFKDEHNKKYESDEEDLKRMEIFAQNKLFVAKHNDLYEKRVVTFTVKMNQFGDLTTDEFNQLYGLKNKNFNDHLDHVNEESVFIPPYYGIQPPKRKDWREAGAVTKVENQGACGSCWAFSAAGALEGQYFLRTKRLVELSKQNLVDCSTAYGNFGCYGGWPSKAFEYTRMNHGIDTEKSYQYKGVQGACRYDAAYSVTNITGFNRLYSNENFLELAVAFGGPVSVLVDAHGDAFRFYDKGVHYNATCSSDLMNLNHAVLVVGYGVEECGCEYWLVKNSWGENWGEQGYIKMARHRGNNCGIVTEAVFPII